MVVYLPVGREEIPNEGEQRTTITELIITVSNWHFNKSAQSLNRSIACAPKDCKVSLKFSSTNFAGGKNKARKNSEETYNFDKGGLCVSYNAFLSLLASDQINTNFWNDVIERYKESTGGADLAKLSNKKDNYAFDEAETSSGQTSGGAKIGNKKTSGKRAGGVQQTGAGKKKKTKVAAVEKANDNNDNDDEDYGGGGDDDNNDYDDEEEDAGISDDFVAQTLNDLSTNFDDAVVAAAAAAAAATTTTTTTTRTRR